MSSPYAQLKDEQDEPEQMDAQAGEFSPADAAERDADSELIRVQPTFDRGDKVLKIMEGISDGGFGAETTKNLQAKLDQLLDATEALEKARNEVSGSKKDLKAVRTAIKRVQERQQLVESGIATAQSDIAILKDQRRNRNIAKKDPSKIAEGIGHASTAISTAASAGAPIPTGAGLVTGVAKFVAAKKHKTAMKKAHGDEYDTLLNPNNETVTGNIAKGLRTQAVTGGISLALSHVPVAGPVLGKVASEKVGHALDERDTAQRHADIETHGGLGFQTAEDELADLDETHPAPAGSKPGKMSKFRKFKQMVKNIF